jgi:D-alanyl-lipoteichoic acid acyltransferase DltB (MBOAT superfamily)
MLTTDYRVVVYAVALLLGLVIFTRVRSRRARQSVLLVGSYLLYATWGLGFATVLLASTVMNFLFGRALRRKQSAGLLWTGIVCNLLLLGSFKYLPGFASSLPFGPLQNFSHIALPLGISFWTFQAMSYLFDLYRGEELDPTLWEFALYMVFFPVAISGPICRMPEMLPQFRSEEPVQHSDIARGLCRIATGALMIQLGQLLGRGILNAGGINAGFDQVKQWSGPDVWCLAFGYGLQLFFDFGGYSHIAIGAARMLGFTVPENFARPFASTTPSIFWTRWHMSLSFWIRDYAFLPLATLRREIWWRNLALVISMVLFGVWHKASLLFVFWGCYHGVLLVFHRQVQQWQRRLNWEPPTALWTPLSWLVTITLVSLGWIFFRANSLPQAQHMLSALVSPSSYATHFLPLPLYLLVLALAVLYAAVLLIIAGLDRYSERLGAEAMSRSEVITIIVRDRWVWLTPMYAFALLIVVWLLTRAQSAGASPFVYRSF